MASNRPFTILWVTAAFMVALVFGVATAWADAPAGEGTWSEHTYNADAPDEARSFAVYVPANLPAGAVPLVVYLHGCGQSIDDAAVGTRWNEWADREGFVVVYPQQRGLEDGALLDDGNAQRCWNWHLPSHQERGSGEPAMIAGITSTVLATQPVDADRVYLAGISAGGAMASVMGATYPDVYAAIGVFAGCGYRTCTDLAGTEAVEAMGDHRRPLPVVVVHATTDPVANYAMGLSARQQWVATNDLLDPGRTDAAGLRPADSSETIQGTWAEGSDRVGDDDPCLRPNQFPCVGSLVGLQDYPHTVDTYLDSTGCEIVQAWSIHGLGHAYSGGAPDGTHTDPRGPGMTELSWNFFQRHTHVGPSSVACAEGAEPTPTLPDESDEPRPGPDDAATDSEAVEAAPLPSTGGGLVWLGAMVLSVCVATPVERRLRRVHGQ